MLRAHKADVAVRNSNGAHNLTRVSSMAAHGVAALAAQGHFILHMSKADFKFNAAHFMVFAVGLLCW